MGPTVILGGYVATLDERLTVIEDGAVAVLDGRIEDVGNRSELETRFPDADVIDASGRLVMPGLINVHTHLYSALARGLTTSLEPSCNFTEILEHLWWRLDRALTEEDVRLSAAVGAIDLIRNGTTTIVDHHASQVHVEGSLSAVADEIERAGLRANLCFEVTDRDGKETRDAGLRENARFAAEVAGGRRAQTGSGPMTGASVGLHASFTLEDETLEQAAGLASDLGVGCHVHVAEDLADVEDSVARSGMRVVQRLDSFGILGDKTVAAHCIHIDDDETRLLRESRTVVAHNPQSNMNNAVGRADVPRMLKENLLVGLGTDGFTSSMFDEMRVANLIHRHAAGDPRVGHNVAADLCLRNNGRIAGRLWGAPVGRIERGAAADVIVLNYDPPTPLVTGNFGGHVIFGLTGWMVETALIGGRIVMKDRELLTIDEREVHARARERAAELWSRM